MTEPERRVKPPRGLSRLLYRLPILLYRARLGWLMGGHFLLLNHTGRLSGLPRQAVLEVIRRDAESGAYYVVSGWGEKSDWLRNVRKTPDVVIQVGRRVLKVRAEILSPLDTERELREYAQRYPTILRTLVRLIGYRYEGTEEDLRALAEKVVVVAFRPRQAESRGSDVGSV